MASLVGPAHLTFLRGLLHNPKAMGAVAPSSPQLARLMASRVDPATGLVLEIGAGTGAITEALLERGIRPERLFVIERDPELAAFLRQKFRAVRVHCADVIESKQILQHHRVAHVHTVISSLPLRNLSPGGRTEHIEAMLESLAPVSQLIQYTYGVGCPFPARRFGLNAERLGWIWQNLPPAAVWRFVKRRP